MLKDKIFNQNMIQNFVTCGLDMKKFAPLDWEGTLIDFLNEDRSEAGVDWWNNLWLVMQVMYPKYRRQVVVKSLTEARVSGEVDSPILSAAIKELAEDHPVKDKLDEISAQADRAYRILAVEQKNAAISYILKSIRHISHFNSAQGLPMAVKELIKVIGKDKVKEIAIRAVSDHP